MAGFEELKEQYWRMLVYTRKSGRISENVKKKVEAQWDQYPREIVEEALRIHIRQYRDPSYKENYTLGIMRNLQKQAQAGLRKQTKEKNSFHDYKQNEYDWDKLLNKVAINR